MAFTAEAKQFMHRCRPLGSLLPFKGMQYALFSHLLTVCGLLLVARLKPLQAGDNLNFPPGVGCDRLVEQMYSTFAAKTDIQVQQVVGNLTIAACDVFLYFLQKVSPHSSASYSSDALAARSSMPKVRKENERNAMASGQINEGQQIKGRLWLENNGRTYLSWGRIVLLERIDEYGSVSAAAKSMQMSFSHAWHLVEDMNALAPEPLVEKQVGGRRGGGAWLTEAGKQAIQNFLQLVERFQGWIEKEQF